ncbi:hypothetical protein E3N88_00150 [Mikania micrantha]|uniref:Uncharacterized protein n=1 Tax=Mikania micrantha TaxID=192012 RepID=A0A5N6PX88_9ASTR|nr:hypothetical protein E3N88_00150 [Mikania micrantha]
MVDNDDPNGWGASPLYSRIKLDFFQILKHVAVSITCNPIHVSSSDEDYTAFTSPPSPSSAKTPSPIEVSRNTMEEVMVLDDKDIKENYESNLEEPPRSLVEDGSG